MFVAFVCLLAVAASGVFAEEPEKLVRGTNAAEGEFPHVVSIRNGGSHHCGGSIISPDVILTAAHCVEPLMDGNSVVTVVSGTNRPGYGGQTHKVKSYLKHHLWNGYNAWDYDIGAIKLQTPIQFNSKQHAIYLANSPPVAGSKTVVSAWGSTGWPSGSLSTTLQKLELPVISQAQCQKALGYNIMGSHICTFKETGSGACFGDSGSPLIQAGRLVGLVSGGIPCATGKPDVFTSVSYLKDFVDRALRM